MHIGNSACHLVGLTGSVGKLQFAECLHLSLSSQLVLIPKPKPTGHANHGSSTPDLVWCFVCLLSPFIRGNERVKLFKPFSQVVAFFIQFTASEFSSMKQMLNFLIFSFISELPFDSTERFSLFALKVSEADRWWRKRLLLQRPPSGLQCLHLS